MRSFSGFVLLGLTTVSILLAGCGGDTNATLDKQIDAIVRPAHESGKFNGTVLVTREDTTVFEQSFGLADVEKNLTNSVATRFLAFSILKPMTAVLVFQQIEADKLRLSDQLESFFPNLAGKPAGRLNLQQLLTHTSGINEVISGHLDRRITPQDLETATVKAGVEFEYSNTAYVCLGLVLEKVTGQSYETLLQEKILQPAGMKDSGLVQTGREIPNLARGYRISSGKAVATDLGLVMEALDGAGSLYTTARDLWRFDQALMKDSILPRKAQELMLTQQVKGRYGYGWFLDEQSGRYFPWHKGDYRGYTAMLVRQIHRQETVIILSNLEETDVLALRTKILRVLKASTKP